MQCRGGQMRASRNLPFDSDVARCECILKKLSPVTLRPFGLLLSPISHRATKTRATASGCMTTVKSKMRQSICAGTGEGRQIGIIEQCTPTVRGVPHPNTRNANPKNARNTRNRMYCARAYIDNRGGLLHILDLDFP